MAKKIKCNQTRCGYLYNGCRTCKSCGAEPFLLDDNCDVCWNCSKDEGILRWDDSYSKLTEADFEKLKDKLKQLKKEAEQRKTEIEKEIQEIKCEIKCSTVSKGRVGSCGEGSCPELHGEVRNKQ
jgi:hypothetical protein